MQRRAPAGTGPAAATTAEQVLTVSARSSTATRATVEAWARRSDRRYCRVALFPEEAWIGSRGMGTTSEGMRRTPTGVYPLSQPFGLAPDPGAGSTYLRVDPDDVWTGSTGSVINRHRRCPPGAVPPDHGAAERLADHPGGYDHGFFIGYNADPPFGKGAAPGRGSAFFFHVSADRPTAGCVAVPSTAMTWLIRWLHFPAVPVVSLGVGSAAYAPIPDRCGCTSAGDTPAPR